MRMSAGCSLRYRRLTLDVPLGGRVLFRGNGGGRPYAHAASDPARSRVGSALRVEAYVPRGAVQFSPRGSLHNYYMSPNAGAYECRRAGPTVLRSYRRHPGVGKLARSGFEDE